MAPVALGYGLRPTLGRPGNRAAPRRAGAWVRARAMLRAAAWLLLPVAYARTMSSNRKRERAEGARTTPLGRIPSVAGVYLEQALDALRDSSSADRLYGELDPWHRDAEILGPVQSKMDAVNRRLRFLRSAVLFSAIAAEAYANEFIAATLSSAEAEAADRLATVDKLLLAPRLAGLESPFERGAEPIQSLARLFRARNALVHPRPGQTGAYAHVVTDDDQRTFGPSAAATFIEATAHAAVLLHPLRPDRPLAAPASRVWEERAVLRDHVALLGDDLRALPAPDSEPIPSLMNQMHERAIKRSTSERERRLLDTDPDP
jgi:hypothetical protein